MPYEAYYSARDTIFDFIVKDAFGPIEKNEILQEPPLDTYVCGILWPKGTSSADVSFPQETRVLDMSKKAQIRILVLKLKTIWSITSEKQISFDLL